MKARQKKEPQVKHPARPAWVRLALWGTAFVGVASLFLMIGIGLWFQSSLNQFKALEAETRIAYETMNEEFPFAVVEGQPPAPARLDAYFRVRADMLDSLPHKLNTMTASFLRAGTVRRIELLRVVSSEMSQIKRATQKHLAGLRQEQMSLNEYLWLHGMVMREVFKNGDPRREELLRVVEGLDRVFASSQWIEDGGFTPEKFEQGLSLTYSGVAALPSDVMSQMDLGNSVACVIDILAANHTRATVENSSENSGS